MRLASILLVLLVSISTGLADSGLGVVQHDFPGYPAAAVNLLSEDHTLHVLNKREESTAPFVAALHYISQQQKELQGLITDNETLSKGWRPLRDPHVLLAPYLRQVYSRSFDSRPNAVYDPYSCRSHYFGQQGDSEQEEDAPSKQGSSGAAFNRTDNATHVQIVDPEAMANFPLPPRAYWSTLSGTWKSDYWTLHSGFVGLPASTDNVSSSARQFMAPGSKRPFDDLSPSLKDRFGRRQADLLTMLFGPKYPGSSPQSLTSQDIRGGKVILQLGRESRLARGHVNGVQGVLSIWPAADRPVYVLPTAAKRDIGDLTGRDLDVESPLPRVDGENEQEGDEKARKDKEALEEYAKLFRYEKPDLKSAGPIEFDLDGLHFLESGLVYAQALPVESSFYTDPRVALSMIPLSRALMPEAMRSPCPPHFNNASAQFNLSEAAAEVMLNATFLSLNETLNRRISRNNASVRLGRMADLSEARTAFHNCSFHFYAHLKPAGPASMRGDMARLEEEMWSPAGITTIREKPAELHSFLYSPDCFLAMTLSPSAGMLTIAEPSRAIRYAVSVFVVLLIQSLVTIRQMDRTQTPSAISKISYPSWAAQCLLDVATFGGHIVAGIFGSSRSSRAMMACAFLAATLFIGLQYQHILTMWSVQAPDFRPPTPPAEVPPTVAEEAGPSATETAGEEASAAGQQPPWWTVQARLRERTRQRPLASGLIVFIVLSIVLPDVVGNLMLLGLYSFWIPQIIRNMQRGTRKAVERRYVLIMSLCRLFFPLYFLACPSNFGQVDNHLPLALFMVFWVLGQAALLIGQSFFGTHFFIPRSMRPKDLSWDWHPPLSTLPAREDPETGAQTLGDCAVCLSAIPVEGNDGIGRAEPEREGLLASHHLDAASSSRHLERSATSSNGLFNSIRAYLKPILQRFPQSIQLSARHEVMMTPCRHIFHTSCLEQWLQVKTECPQCRSPLPPV